MDSTLKLAVQGMEHISRAPANYEPGSSRVPLKNCCLRIRKVLRDTIDCGFQNLTDTPKPYRMQGKTRSLTLPAPTATDSDGGDMDPVRAVQLRVEGKHQETPRQLMPMMPMINNKAYTYVSTIGAQERVDRRRGALGLDRQVESSARRTEPGAVHSRDPSRMGKVRSRSPYRERDLRETITRRMVSNRHSKTPPPSTSRRRSRTPPLSTSRRHSATPPPTSSTVTRRSSRSPTGSGSGLKMIKQRRTNDGYRGPTERKMAEMRAKTEKDRLQEEREELEKEREVVKRKQQEREDWEAQQDIDRKRKQIEVLKNQIEEASPQQAERSLARRSSARSRSRSSGSPDLLELVDRYAERQDLLRDKQYVDYNYVDVDTKQKRQFAIEKVVRSS